MEIIANHPDLLECTQCKDLVHNDDCKKSLIRGSDVPICDECASKKRLVCDHCSNTYVDELSVLQGIEVGGQWAESCRKRGKEPRGLFPCPLYRCDGELVLVEG